MNTSEYSKKNQPDPFRIGIICRKMGNGYTLLANGSRLNASLPGALRKEVGYSTGGKVRPFRAVDDDPLAVGDEVYFETVQGGAARIVEILPRRSLLSRRSALPMPGARPMEQYIAANADLVMPVFAAAQPPPKWNLLDRYLAAAESVGIPALICITKSDLLKKDPAEDEKFSDVLADYARIGYRVILTSTVSGQGLDELRDALRGRTTVLLGKSGVGKTTLLNGLIPGLGKRVGAISRATGKGRHTTSASELIPLDGDGALIDTPGVREFGLWDVEPEEMAVLFPEMRPFLGRCRFGAGCSHDEEPGCAVRRAVMDGRISPRRYASYLRLREE